MPAKSQAQQILMGQAWAVRNGDMSINDVDLKYRQQVRDIAHGDMSDEELKKFAKTKRNKLPKYANKAKPSTKHVKESDEFFKGPGGSTDKIGVKPGSAKIYPYLDVDSKKGGRGKRNLENLKDYRDWIAEREEAVLVDEIINEARKKKKENPQSEYKEENRRSINLDAIRKTKEYTDIIDLGFKDDTSHQQELNNTLKFIRSKKKQKEKGHDDVFYTIHPTGVIRRYNPPKGDDVPEGSGNDLKRFPKKFERPSDYRKGLRYLWQYLRRKEMRKDFR